MTSLIFFVFIHIENCSSAAFLCLPLFYRNGGGAEQAYVRIMDLRYNLLIVFCVRREVRWFFSMLGPFLYVPPLATYSAPTRVQQFFPFECHHTPPPLTNLPPSNLYYSCPFFSMVLVVLPRFFSPFVLELCAPN